MKIAINCCYGGFSLSKAAYEELGLDYDGYGYIFNEDLGIESDSEHAYRANPELIRAIEKIGEENAGGKYASIRIIEIPDDVEWIIEEYDGVESVHEKHRVWY